MKQAGDVSKNIEIFEETVCMIPARGDVAEAAYVVLSLFNMRHKIYSFSRHSLRYSSFHVETLFCSSCHSINLDLFIISVSVGRRALV